MLSAAPLVAYGTVELQLIDDTLMFHTPRP